MKICTKCGEEKDESNFRLRNKKQGGIEAECKVCMAIRNKKWATANRAKRNAQQNARNAANRDEVRRKGRERHAANREAINARKAKQRKKRHKKDLNYRILGNLRCRVLGAVKQQWGTKSARTLDLVGCSVDFLRGYIEARFTLGMTWENYGYHGWHIDHRIPCAEFDLTDPEQQRQCFHYSNLQPLWALENLVKNSTKPATHQAELI